MVCPRCETANHPADECPERHEEYHGLPSDHFDADAGIVCWVQDLSDDWHASMYFEDTRHVAACGEILETPVADVRDDPRRLAETHTCDDCEAALEADEEETVPDGGEFERASKLRADGGEVAVYQWVLDTVHEYPAATDSRWGCRRNLVHQGRKLDGVSKDDVEEAIASAVDNEDLISWHGLLARTEIDRLREIVRAEHEEHEITRSILVGKCNKLIATKKQEQAGDGDREVATDGGLPGWAERTADGNVRCTACGNQAQTVARVNHDCIYQNDLVADGGRDPDDLVVLVCEPCDYQTVVAAGALPATSCPDCQGDLEIDDDHVAHKCPAAADVNHVTVEAGGRCPFCQTVQQRVATDGGTSSDGTDHVVVCWTCGWARVGRSHDAAMRLQANHDHEHANIDVGTRLQDPENEQERPGQKERGDLSPEEAAFGHVRRSQDTNADHDRAQLDPRLGGLLVVALGLVMTGLLAVGVTAP